jgi:hypothetical protein
MASLAPGVAWARDDAGTTAPEDAGTVPEYRTTGSALLVCTTDVVDFTLRTAAYSSKLLKANQDLWTKCQANGFHDLQEAVNHVTSPGMIIKVLPGEYREEPSLADPSADCASLAAGPGAAGDPVLDHDQQVRCPNNQNLVAILEKKNLQIEGTGAAPSDVVITGQYRKLNTLLVDQSPGIYLRNFTVERATANALLIRDTDGFAVESMLGRWTGGSGFLARADDHGLLSGCEAYGNGNAGIRADSTPNLNANARYDVTRYAIEIHNCYGHDNVQGYSGTAGDSVWAHDNRFLHNSVGLSTSSASGRSSALPQNHALFEGNSIGNNNANYYGFVRDGTCAKPYDQRGDTDGVVCPAVGVPPGTGVLNLGGNYDTWRDNWVYGNDYVGFASAWEPGILHGIRRLGAQVDTSHHNRYYGNHLGVSPDGTPGRNGMDFWWDGQGVGSCWQDPVAGSAPRVLPSCDADNLPSGRAPARYVGEPVQVLKLYVCSRFDPAAAQLPSGCDWYGARGLGRIEVRAVVGEAVLIGLALLLAWWRVLRWSAAGAFGLLLCVAGLVVGIFGTVDPASLLTAIGLNLLGVGWVVFGAMLYRKRHPGLGFLTCAMGVFALLGAIDRGIWMLPYVPVPPSLWRISLEVFWVPTTLLVALLARHRPATAVSRASKPPRRRRYRDALEAFTARLRAGF